MAENRSNLLGMLQKFDGTDMSYRWSEFRNRLLVTVDPALSDREKVRILMLLLKGDAALFFDANPTFANAPFDYVLHEFDTQYRIPEAQVQIQVTSITQAPNESVASFGSRIRVATNALHPEDAKPRIPAVAADGQVILDEGQIRMIANPLYERHLGVYQGKLASVQQLQITHFIKGLNPRIAAALPHHRFTDWASLIQSATATEEKLASLDSTYLSAHLDALHSHPTATAAPAPAPPAAAAAAPASSQLDALCAALAQVTTNLEALTATRMNEASSSSSVKDTGAPRAKRPVKCFKCNKLGHIARHCHSTVPLAPAAAPPPTNLADDMKKAMADAIAQAMSDRSRPSYQHRNSRYDRYDRHDRRSRSASHDSRGGGSRYNSRSPGRHAHFASSKNGQ